MNKLLIVRQDNIGDLVCTTPLIEGIRATFPNVHITVLCTSYNRAVLERNPYINRICAYAKRSHHGSIFSLVAGSIQKVLLIWQLRRECFDLVIAASTPCGKRVSDLVAMIKPARFLCSSENGDSADHVPASALEEMHEVERVWEIGKRMGLAGRAPGVRVYPDTARAKSLRGEFFREGGRLVAVHISSRKPSQQWPARQFAELLRILFRQDTSLRFVVLWAPGGTDQLAHSGDDAKAKELEVFLDGSVPVVFQPTPSLEGTIEALAACDYFIGSDGGAMHLAAACGLPVVALFGASDTLRWYPWTPARRVLQAESKEVRDLSADKVAEAFLEILADQGAKNAGSK